MNMKMIAGACMCAAAIVGCVSVEQTRLQLQSKDSAEVKKAEENIYRIATEGRDPSGFVEFTPAQQAEYVSLVSNNDLLLRIMDRSREDKVIRTAAEKLDFSKAGLAKEIFSKHKELFEDYKGRVLDKIEGFEDKMCGNLNENEAVLLLRDSSIRSGTHDKIMQRLLDVTENVTILYDLYNEKFGNYPGSKGRALKKLLANTDKISDKAIVIALLASDEVNDEAIRKKLISKLPSGEAEIYTLNECKDDKAFYEAFKKANDEVKKKVFGRVLRMKDETLLADFVRHNPSAASKVNFRSVKTPELASVLLDTVKDVLLEGSYTYGTMHSTVDWFVFELVQKLDAKGRAKYLKAAKENLEAARKDNVILCDKFYVNMPVIDYVVISFEENLAWTQKPGAVIDYLDGYADMKTDISGKDWRKEWKIKRLVFIAKDRQKYFNVKGTREGLLDFVEKYIDKSASITDTTLSKTGWWQYNDDKHGLSVFVNDNSGVLEIDRR